jgi:hypothetical protein
VGHALPAAQAAVDFLFFHLGALLNACLACA